MSIDIDEAEADDCWLVDTDYEDDDVELDDQDVEGELIVHVEKEFKLLTQDQLAAKQDEDLVKICNVMDIDQTTARTFLTIYKWDEEALMSRYLDSGMEYIQKQAGIFQSNDSKDKGKSNPSDHGKATTTTTSSSAIFSCPSCFDEGDMASSTAFECGHRFCNSCWEAYFRVKIKDGESSTVICMGQKCSIPVPEPFLLSFFKNDNTTVSRYNRFLLDSYVLDSTRRKWCPSAPHCGRAVEVNYGRNVDVDCACGTSFCFRCSQSPPHSPALCDMKKKWDKKSQDDSETANWFTTKTKECPKCGKTIEKDGGCNLVTCKCGQHFCWLCGEATGAAHTWTDIAGHTCGQYKDKDGSVNSARRSLERYMHFYQHYQAQVDSTKAEAKLKQDVPRKTLMLRSDTQHSYGSAELAWLEKAVIQLDVSRRVLGNSYVFAYYVFEEDWALTQGNPANETDKKPAVAAKKNVPNVAVGRGKPLPAPAAAPPPQTSANPLKNIFDHAQEQIEFTTERLSKLLEAPLEKIDEKHLKDIMAYTVLADKRCAALFDVIQNAILSDGSLVPTYRPLVPTAEMESAVFSPSIALPTFEAKKPSISPPVVKKPASFTPEASLPTVAAPKGSKNKQQDTTEQEAKRKKFDPQSDDYDEDEAFEAALKQSAAESPTVTRTKPTAKHAIDVEDEQFDDDEDDAQYIEDDDDFDFKKAIQRSLAESKGIKNDDQDDDADFKMALQLSLTEK